MASGKTGSKGVYLFLFIILLAGLIYLRKYNVDQRKVQIYDSMLGQFTETTEEDAIGSGASGNTMAPPEDIEVPSDKDAQDRLDKDLKNKDEQGGNDAMGADRQDIIDEIRRLSEKVCLFPPDELYGCYGAFEEDPDQIEERDEALAMIPVLEAQLANATMVSDMALVTELKSELESVYKTAYEVVCCSPKVDEGDNTRFLDEAKEFAIGLSAAIVVGILLEEAIKKGIGVKPKYTPPSTAAKVATKKVLKEATADAAIEAGELAAKRAAKEGLDEAGQKLAREVAETAVQSSTNLGMRKLSQEVGEEAAEKVFKEAGERAVAEVVKRGGSEAAQLAAKKAAQEGATEAMEMAASKAIKSTLGDLTKSIVKESVKAAVEEGAKTAAINAAGKAAAEKAAREGLDEAAQLAAREAATALAEREAAKAATEKAAKEAGDAAAKKAVKNGGDIITQRAAREAAEKGVREASEKVIGKALLERTIRDAVLESTIKQAGDTAATRAAREGLDETGQKLAREAAEKAAREAGEKATKKAVAKTLAKQASKKATAKVLAKVGVKIATKVATKTAKYALMAVAGPPGWVAGALMLAFDALSMTMDILDTQGYSTYTPNDALETIRNKVLADGERNSIEGGGAWPLLFPITELAPLEYPVAVDMMTSDMTLNYGMPTVEFDPVVGPQYTAYIERVVEQLQLGEEPDDAPAAFVDYLVKIPEVYHKQRDVYIFEHLKKLIKMSSTPERADMLTFLPFMSSPKRVGISITPEAAAQWNTKSMPEWIENNAIVPPFPEPCEDYLDPTAAMYTDVFYSMNPSFYDVEENERPEDMQGDMLTNPVLTPVPIQNEDGEQVKVVLGVPLGPSVAFCLKRRQGGLPGVTPTAPIDPQQFGVGFDFTTGMCSFTKDFCNRYGMDFANNDCKAKPGMKVAEFVFGEVVTKSFVRSYQTYVMDNIQSQDPARVAAGIFFASSPAIMTTIALGETIFGQSKVKGSNIIENKTSCDEYGDRYRDDGTSCWLDTIPKDTEPTDLKSCSAWERQPDGTPGSEGGDYTNLTPDGRSCWSHTIPIGSAMADKKHCDNWSHKYGRNLRDDGTSCWRDTLMKESSPAEPKGCDNWAHEYGLNMRDDGTSCWRDTEVKDTDNAKKRDCEGLPLKDLDGSIIPDKYEWRDQVTREDGSVVGEGQGKLRFDGTSCWRDIYPKTAKVAEQRECKGPKLRDSDGSIIPDKYEWRDRVTRTDGSVVGEGRGKLRNDGTSCWKDLYTKKAEPADKKSCSEWDHKYGGAKLESDLGNTSCWLTLKGRDLKLPGCEADEEKKGLLCYKRCDTRNKGVRGGYKPYKLHEDGTEDGVQIYKSRAFECEGICPPGTQDSGFFCTDWVHTFFKNMSSSTEMDSCSDRKVDANSGKGQRLLAAAGISAKAIARGEYGTALDYQYDDWALTCVEPCEPGTTRKSGAIDSAFCNSVKPRYTRGFNPKEANVCPTDYPNKQMGICYKDCPEGYTGYGPICQPDSGVGIKVNVFQRYYCGPSSYQPDKCEALSDRDIPGIVSHLESVNNQGDLINRINASGLTDALYTEAENALGCPVLRKNRWGVCWDECRDGDKEIGFLCNPKGGFGIKKTLFDRYYCESSSSQSQKCEDIASKDISKIKPLLETAGRQDLIDRIDIDGLSDTLHEQIQHVLGCPELRENIAGVCWDKCKDGDQNWGALCKPNKQVGIIKNLFDRYYCEDERKENVLGVCWEDCDRYEEKNSTETKKIEYENAGALCHPRMGPGIKVDMFRRGECGSTTWQPKKCQSIIDGDTNTVIDYLEGVTDMEDHSFRTAVGLSTIITKLKSGEISLTTDEVRKDVEDALDCPVRRKNIAGICWDKCPPFDKDDHSVGHGVDYEDIGLLCHPKGMPGIKVPVWDREVCGPKEYQKQECVNISEGNISATVQDLNAIGETALASKLASDGYTSDLPTDEFPDGMERMKMNVETALGCPERRKKILGVCWDDCPPRYTRIGALCQPPGGPGIKVPVWEREFCGPSSHQSQKCEDVASKDLDRISEYLRDIGREDILNRIIEDGLTDALYKEVEAALDCPIRRKRILGLCWDRCPQAVTPKNIELFTELRTQYFEDKPLYEEAERNYFNLLDIISRDDGFTPDYIMKRRSGMGDGRPGHRWSDEEVVTYNDMFSIYINLKNEFEEQSGSKDNFTEQCVPGFERSNIRGGYCAPVKGWAAFSTGLQDKLDEYKSIYETLKLSFDSLSENYFNEKKEYERTRSFGYDDIGALCQPKGGRDPVTNKTKSNGPGIKVTHMKRAYCDDDQDKILGICYDKCPDGWRDDGLICNDRSGLDSLIASAIHGNPLTTSSGTACAVPSAYEDATSFTPSEPSIGDDALGYSEEFISTPITIEDLPRQLKEGEIEISEFLYQYFDEMETFDISITPTSIIPTMTAIVIELGDVNGVRVNYVETLLEMYTAGDFTPLPPADQSDMNKFFTKYFAIESDGFILASAPENVRNPINLLLEENLRLLIIDEVDKFSMGNEPYDVSGDIEKTFTFVGNYIGITGNLSIEDAPAAALPILESAIAISGGSIQNLRTSFGALIGYAVFAADDDDAPPTMNEMVLDTGTMATINGVKVRGMGTFKVSTSDEVDGVYTPVPGIDVFTGDTSSNEPLLIDFPVPVVSQFVRLDVLTWNETFLNPLTEGELQAQSIQVEVDKFNLGEDPYFLDEPTIDPGTGEETQGEIQKTYLFVGIYLATTGNISIEEAPESARPILESAVAIAGSMDDLKLAFADVFALM